MINNYQGRWEYLTKYSIHKINKFRIPDNQNLNKPNNMGRKLIMGSKLYQNKLFQQYIFNNSLCLRLIKFVWRIFDSQLLKIVIILGNRY